MRHVFSSPLGLVVAVEVLVFALPAAGAPDSAKDDRKWCLMCHTEPSYAGLQKSAHKRLLCRECHEGYQLNPHDPIEEPTADVSKLEPFVKSDAVALASCSGCHEDVGSATDLMPHGQSDGGLAPPAPYCLECHGDPHQIASLSSLADNQLRLAQNAICTSCHADATRMDGGARSIGTEPAETYADSIHLRKLHLGSPRAPGCVDCHGAHAPKAPRESAQEACAECHKGATAAFASLVTHQPVNAVTRPVPYYTQKFFAWLTLLTVMGLLAHVALDITQSLGGRRGRKEE